MPSAEDRTTGFYERPPGTPICAAHVRVETIGNDGVTPGAQHDSQAFTERGEARGVMHQGRLKSAVILDASGIVEEWIGWRRRDRENLGRFEPSLLDRAERCALPWPW